MQMLNIIAVNHIEKTSCTKDDEAEMTARVINSLILMTY